MKEGDIVIFTKKPKLLYRIVYVLKWFNSNELLGYYEIESHNKQTLTAAEFDVYLYNPEICE
jgi:hypothetical protein